MYFIFLNSVAGLEQRIILFGSDSITVLKLFDYDMNSSSTEDNSVFIQLSLGLIHFPMLMYFTSDSITDANCHYLD